MHAPTGPLIHLAPVLSRMRNNNLGKTFFCWSSLCKLCGRLTFLPVTVTCPFGRGASTLDGDEDTTCPLRLANQIRLCRDPLQWMLCVSTVNAYHWAKCCSCRSPASADDPSCCSDLQQAAITSKTISRPMSVPRCPVPGWGHCWPLLSII